MSFNAFSPLLQTVSPFQRSAPAYLPFAFILTASWPLENNRLYDSMLVTLENEATYHAFHLGRFSSILAGMALRE
jgi:hypothetical protein